jgi:hypothetical protein
VTQTIAASNQGRFPGTVHHARHFSIHDSMNKKSPVPQKQNDLSWTNVVKAGLVDRNQITRKDGGHHARAKDTQADPAECADDFLRQSTYQLDRSIPLIVRQHLNQFVLKLSGRNHGHFGWWQFSRAPAPRPRAQNRTSNWASRAGFLSSDGSGAFSFEFLSLFNCPPEIHRRGNCTHRGCPGYYPAPCGNVL